MISNLQRPCLCLTAKFTPLLPNQCKLRGTVGNSCFAAKCAAQDFEQAFHSVLARQCYPASDLDVKAVLLHAGATGYK